jgi:beta-N-acetylhexosaminidase
MSDIETVVVGTVRAATQEEQGETIRTLLNAGKRVIVVALRDPFDLLAFPEAPCFLATYGDGPLELAALASVLYGDIPPAGRLPVELPRLHARGHFLPDGGR